MSKTVSIVADIGGTNARFASVYLDNQQLHNLEVVSCEHFPLLVDALRAYIDRGSFDSIERVCLAVAGPVESDWVELPNNHWSFSQAELQQSLSVPVVVINDFSAQAYSINALHSSQLHWIGSPRPAAARRQGSRVKAILGPGTGLGVSAIISGSHIVPSEAGHVAFAPVSQHEADLLQILWRRNERISVERVLSGMGLENLYWANCQAVGIDRELSAQQITDGASGGDEYCCRAINDFFAILGSVAGDVALMMGASSGVYVSGGIVPKIRHLLNEDLFRQRFDNKGRFSQYCSQIPLSIVLAEHPGLIGCVEALKLSRS